MIRQQTLYRNHSLLGSQSSGSVRHLGAACPGFGRVPGEASASTRGRHTAGCSTVPTTPLSLPGPSVKQQEGRETPGGGPLAMEGRDRLCPESLNHCNQSDRQTRAPSTSDQDEAASSSFPQASLVPLPPHKDWSELKSAPCINGYFWLIKCVPSHRLTRLDPRQHCGQMQGRPAIVTPAREAGGAQRGRTPCVRLTASSA